MKAKRLLAILLSLTMMLGSFTITASASNNSSTYTNKTMAAFSDTIFPATRTDFRDESIYYLMITRFYDGDSGNNVHCWDDGQAGNPDSDPAWRGDFKGLIEKLDYIKALGFTAVQLTPVAQNASGYDYHGYHPINLNRVDPRFESEGYTYQDLINACHERDLKVIQEINFNSTSNFGEAFLCNIFEVNEDADLSNIEEAVTPTKLLLDTYGLSSAEDYWTQKPAEQYRQRLNIMKNLEYSPDNGNSTGILPAAKDYDIGKLSSSAIYNPNNYYHSGYFQSINWDDWSCKFCQIAGDHVDINTENPAVAKYLLETCKMYVDMGVDALIITDARHIDRLSLNIQFIDQIKDLFREKGKEPAIFLDVITRYTSVWYRGHATESGPYYTWKESDSKWADQWSWGTSIEDINNNMNVVFDHTIEEDDINDEPTSDNALLNGIEYHTPDYSMAGANVNDYTMHRNFGSASTAFNISKAGDKYFNDSTWNITFVNSYDYSPESPGEKYVFSGETYTWKENLCLMFTFRGIPRVLAGTEVEFQKGAVIDIGPTAPLSETGRAYYGDHIEGSVYTNNFADYTASGTVAATLDSTLAKHIQRLNLIRMAVPALRKGQYTTSSNYVTGDMAFIRRYTNESEKVDSLALVTIGSEAEFKNIPNGRYVDAVTGDVQNVTNGTLRVPAPNTPEVMSVYVCEAEGFTGLTTEFDVDSFTMSFDGDGAEGRMDSVRATYSGYVTLPDCTFTTPANKRFKAWLVNGVEYNAGESVYLSNDTTAKAVWRDIEYCGLNLGDIVVSEANKDDILGDGTASYDPDTFTLTLNGYKNKGITTSLDKLNISLAADSQNKIDGDTYGIYSDGGSITISGDASLTITAGDTAIFAKNGDISVTSGILNALGEKGIALDASGSIRISDAYVTAVSYQGTALSKAPILDGFTKYKAVASGKANGSDAAEYVSSDNGIYKYFKVNPYYTAGFMSEDGKSTLYTVETQSGILALPEFSVIGADEGSYAYWLGNGKYYLPGAKLAIDADTEFVPVSGGDGAQVEDNAIYLQNDAGWSTVTAYYWGDGVYPVSWPGKAMENIEGTNIWKITDIPSGCDKILFHNGSTQTGDLVIPTDGNNIYSNSTNKWSEYSPGIKAEDTSGVNIVSFRAGVGMGYMKELLNESGTYTLPQCLMIYPENGEFVAWSIGGTEYQPGDVITISEDAVISAVWNLNGIEQAADGNYYYYVDGVVDTAQSGLKYYEPWNKWVYFEEGQWITTKDSLVEYDGSWFYVQNGELENNYSGLLEYDSNLFFVSGGQVQSSVNGLVLNSDGIWYYLGGGQVQKQYTGLAEYDGAWFYVVNGELENNYSGLLEYDSNLFFVSGGQVQSSVNGLVLNSDGIWYYLGGGQVQKQYTGLAEYDGAWFYIRNGVLDTSFSGTVTYDGVQFEVVNGQVVTE